MPAGSPAPQGSLNLAETWLVNQRTITTLLDGLSDEQFAYQPPGRGKSIAGQFAHMHNVRLYWLSAIAPPLATGMEKIEKGEIGRRTVREALEQSATAFAQLLREAEASGRLKGYKRGPVTFLGYMLAHEGHHRGQILLHLKNGNLAVDRTLAFRIWEWDKL